MKVAETAGLQKHQCLFSAYIGCRSSNFRLKEIPREMGSEGLLQAAKVYRHLLKAVKKNIGKEDYKKHFTDFITQEFRKTADPSNVLQKINLARDYTFMLNSVHHHKDLLFSYNIAVDRSDEVTKTLRKSAASVGLELPDVYQP